jgi:hypothetical protein
MENKNFKVNPTTEILKNIKKGWQKLMWDTSLVDSYMEIVIDVAVTYTWVLPNDIYDSIQLIINDDTAKIIINNAKTNEFIEFENISDFDRYCWESDRIMSKYESERLEAIKNWAAENLVSE